MVAMQIANCFEGFVFFVLRQLWVLHVHISYTEVKPNIYAADIPV